MNTVIIGTGYVGLTTGVALAYVGHDVTCVDLDPGLVERLSRGEATIHEPGLEELLHLAQDHLTFTTDLPDLEGDTVVVIAVGTPPKENGDADMAYVDVAARQIAERIQPGADLVVVNKSTVPIGSARHVDGIVRRTLRERGVEATVAVASNPEFLAEGRAVRDSLYPDRIVVGADDDDAVAMLRRLYEPLLEQAFEAPPGIPRPDRMPLPPLITTTPTSAELTKYAANSFLATKISFINEFAGLAERVGADVTQVARAIGLDDRIGSRFLHAGIGWGGSCFGKDTRAILATADVYDFPMPVVQAAVDVNYQQRVRIVEKLQEHLKVLRGTTIGILGLAFKGDTDDLRDAPALTLIEVLQDRGAQVRVHDPVAMDNAKALEPSLDVTYATDAVDLAEGCDALVVATDWDAYRHLPLDDVAAAMRGRVVVDARNLLDPDAVRARQLRYVGVGR
ncbi:MAG: UDP-glucose/GDP-mannose dehydrogenase family protein [Trueperaceae bacterium]|nr:UDP-glucose/GDP-mannose dehydrogenase family protein [Trueperaceae bacterium]